MTGTVYPESIDNFATLPVVTDNVSPIKADDVNRLRGAIIAVEDELGKNPSGTFGTVRARLDALEESGGGGGGGGGVILDNKGDLITRTDDEEVALPVGTDGYVLISDSTQDTGLRWGTLDAGEMPDFLNLEVQDPDNKQYFLTIETPFSGRVESITTICSAGSFQVDGYINSTHLGGTANAVSTSEQTRTHASSNSFAIGDSISIVVTGADFTSQNLRVTLKYIRSNSVGNLGEVNIGQNVGVGGVGPYKQKTANILEFRNTNAGSSKISVTLDSVNDEIDIDAVEANFTHNNIGGTLSIAKGGTGQTTASTAFDALAPTTTKGDLIVRNSSSNTRVAIGTDGYILTADSAQATGVKWSQVNNVPPIDARYVTLAINSTLTQERVLAGRSGQITITDGGAGSNVTLDLANTAVTPGSYTLSSITVDGYGRITSASTGSAAPVSASYLTLALNGTLTQERVLVAGSGHLVLSDSGANGNAVLSLANTAVTPGSYTNTNITVDGYGRITSASNGSSGSGSGANTALSNLATTTINTSLLPAVNDGYNIGSSSLRWSNIFAAQNIKVINNSATEILEEVYSNTAGVAPTLSLKRAEGTLTVPGEVVSNDIIGTFNFTGHDGVSFVPGASIISTATQSWTPSTRGSKLNIKTILDGASSQTSRIFIDSDGSVGISTENPLTKLHVQGDGYFAGFVRPQDANTSASSAGDGSIRWRSTNLQFSDGNDWFNITKGNTKLLPFIGDAAVPDVLHLFCNSVTGSDISGDGLSASTAFASIQRALDEIPDGAQGFVQIDLIGAGPYKTWRVRNYHSDFLQISIVGDTQGTPVQTWTLGAGSLPTNPTGGTKHGVFEYGVGSYSTVLSDGYGWLEFQSTVGSSYITYAYTIDGYGSHSPNLRVAYPLDLGTEFSGVSGLLRHFTTAIVGTLDIAPEYGAISHDSSPDGNSTSVFAMGLVFRNFAELEVHRTNFKGCLFDDSEVRFTDNDNCFIDAICMGTTTYNALDGKSTSFQGIWAEDTTIELSGPMVETFLGGILRNRDGSGVCAYIGGVTGGRAPTPCAIEIEFLDLESIIAANLAGFVIRGASVRFGNHAPISLNNPSRWFIAQLGARVTVVRANGGVLGVPCIFDEGVIATGFDSLDGDVFNLSSSGDEVTIGDIGTLAFSDLPQTDLANLIRVE